MPQISELFVALGVKGSAHTIEALSNVRLTMGSISTAALAATATILGMTYALEKLTTNATSNAQDIQNLSKYLDMSQESLQRWHWTAKQAGISTQELDQSFSSIQQHIKDFNTKHSLPQGSAIFAQETGFNFTKPFKADDVMKAAIEFAKNKRIPQTVKESILEGWGITPDEISQSMIGRFNPENLSKAPLLSNNEIKKLSDLNVQFSNLETKVGMFFSHFTAAHSKEILTTLSDMTNAFLKLASVLDKIATKLHLFDALDSVFKGWITIFDIIDGKKGNPLKIMEERKKAIDQLEIMQEKQKVFQQKLGFENFKQNILDMFNLNPINSLPNRFSLYANNNPPNINQNLYFQHSGEDHMKNQESHKYAFAQAYRMSSAQSRTT